MNKEGNLHMDDEILNIIIFYYEDFNSKGMRNIK
jgi:hypothetical protein